MGGLPWYGAPVAGLELGRGDKSPLPGRKCLRLFTFSNIRLVSSSSLFPLFRISQNSRISPRGALGRAWQTERHILRRFARCARGRAWPRFCGSPTRAVARRSKIAQFAKRLNARKRKPRMPIAQQIKRRLGDLDVVGSRASGDALSS